MGHRSFGAVVGVIVPLALSAGMLQAETTIEIHPTNLTGGNVNDVEIHSLSAITGINPPTVPPFTITNGVGTNTVTLSGGTLANGASITATLTLLKNKATISHYSWTVNGTVIGSSIVTYSGVPIGKTPNDCHIKVDWNITAFKVVEPPGWTAAINPTNPKQLDLTGPQITQGTNVKVEIYVWGHAGPIKVGNFTWTLDGATVGSSAPVLCWNYTETAQHTAVLVATRSITAITPNPPLPFTNVQGLGTNFVYLTGATIPPGDGVGDEQGIVQAETDPGDPNFAVFVQWGSGEPPGACCYDNGICVEVTAEMCGTMLGDVNCDDVIDFDDINPFVAVLSGAPGIPGCPSGQADCDQNGFVDFDDINPFVAFISGGAPVHGMWLGPNTTCDLCCKLDCNDPNYGVTHPEIEQCGQDLNGGCNSNIDPNDPNSPPDPNAWEDLGILDPNNPTVICGTLWADNGVRDTDWYKFGLPIQGTLSWETQSDIPLLSTPVFANGNLGAPTIAANCGGGPLWGYWNSPRAYLCTLGVIAPTDVFPGGPTYWWIAFPDSGSAIFYGYPCANNWVNYRITITNVSLVCDPCLQTDRQEGETECLPTGDVFNSGCDSTNGTFHIDPNNAPLLPATYYCGKSGTWADPNGNTLVDYDWWKIVLSGTVKKRLLIQMRAAFNMQWELYSVPGDVCANKVRLDYYEFGACEANVSIYTTCLDPNATYYMRILPTSTVDCTQWNKYRFQYSVVTEAPACTTCSVVCSTTLDNPCQSDPNGAETNMGCNASDPNAAGNYMAYVAGNNTYGAKYCGRTSTFTTTSGASVDLDWFRYTQLPARTKLVIRGKAMFRMSINIALSCADAGVTHGWDRPCKGTTTSATQLWTLLTPGATYTGVVIYGNGGGDGTGEQPLKQFFFGLPCSDNRNNYELELQCQT
jgi:hypothetical protein